MNLIEIKKTKNSKEENFPVGSWLLSKELRPQILIFYKFARAADDIADSTNLSSNEKVKRLNLFKKADFILTECNIERIDLTAEFVNAGNKLTEFVGLSEKVNLGMAVHLGYLT